MSDARSDRADAAGRVVDGRYALGAVIRETSWCAVYEALALERSSPVCVTLLYGADARRAFRQHHTALSEPSLSCWLTIRAHGIEQDGSDYFVTDAIIGSPLDELLEREGPLDLGAAARLLLALCADLEKAKGEVELFRALEPDDIWIRRDDHGAWSLQISWLGVLGWLASGSRKSPESEASLLVSLLVKLAGQARLVASPELAEMVERALSTDPRERYADRGQLMAALLPLTRSSSGPVPRLSEPPCPRFDEDVQVSVYRPRSVVPGKWYRLLTFVHLGHAREGDELALDPLEEVQRRAEAALGRSAALYASTRQESLLALPEGGQIHLVPEVQGVEFNPRSRSFEWRQDVHDESFQLRAKRHPEGTILRGRLSAYLGTVLLADVTLKFAVVANDSSEPEALVPERAVSYRKIFASYSHADSRIVSDFNVVVSALGDRYLLDVQDLRSGQVWTTALEQLIEEADIFQLFWSKSSMRSEFCRREWEYALERRKPIRPVYWEDPMPRDPEVGLPPPALAKLHFAPLGIAAPPANDTLPPPPGANDALDLLGPGSTAAPRRRPGRWLGWLLGGTALGVSGFATLAMSTMMVAGPAHPTDDAPDKEGGSGISMRPPPEPPLISTDQHGLEPRSTAVTEAPPPAKLPAKPPRKAVPTKPSMDMPVAPQVLTFECDDSLQSRYRARVSVQERPAPPWWPLCDTGVFVDVNELPAEPRVWARGRGCRRVKISECRDPAGERPPKGGPAGPTLGPPRL